MFDKIQLQIKHRRFVPLQICPFVLKFGDFKSQTKHFRKGRVAQLIHESTEVHRPDMFAVSWQGEVRNDFCLNNICVGNWLSSFFNT